jgi:RimJ/RimL family protein N-acetyltransferase
LRKFDASDIKALFDIFSDEEVNVYLPMLPLKALEEAKAFLRKSMKGHTNSQVDISTPSI